MVFFLIARWGQDDENQPRNTGMAWGIADRVWYKRFASLHYYGPVRVQHMMVKISFASIFFLLATLSSLSFTFPIKPRTVSDLETDLNKLAVDVAQLASSLKSINSGVDVVGDAVSGRPISRIP